MPNQIPILVAGGGTGGLAAALGLAQHGIAVVVGARAGAGRDRPGIGAWHGGGSLVVT